jgi:hypothetical protein
VSFPIELTNRYARTFLDFWRLRPRKFLVLKADKPELYLSPYEFLVISLGLAFSMLIVAASLTVSAFQTGSGSIASDPKALAGRLVVFSTVMIGLNTVCSTFCSRPWPIRKRPTIVQFFEFNCYMCAVIMPMAAFDVLFDPVVADLVARHVIPLWGGLLLLYGAGAAIGIIYLFTYSIPGLAFIAGVSSSRMAAGLFLWPTVVAVTFFVLLFLVEFFVGYVRALLGP